jgi:hypothetical protein
MIGMFFEIWFRLVSIICFLLLLGGGIPLLVSLFWPIVFMCGIMSFFSTAIAIDRIGREASQQLHRK